MAQSLSVVAVHLILSTKKRGPGCATLADALKSLPISVVSRRKTWDGTNGTFGNRRAPIPLNTTLNSTRDTQDTTLEITLNTHPFRVVEQHSYPG